VCTGCEVSAGVAKKSHFFFDIAETSVDLQPTTRRYSPEGKCSRSHVPPAEESSNDDSTPAYGLRVIDYVINHGL
jgi:hypothetical protein